MSTEQPTPLPPELADLSRQLGDPHKGTSEGFDVKGGEGYSERLVDQIEMMGEEEAAGYNRAPEKDAISPGMRYLHSSRTIHQLVTDRNRAVGIFLAVASLLLTASGALVHANPTSEDLIVPIRTLQRWCLPITFGVLTLLAFFVDFLLIRTRVGLIYEVAKMNALLGLPVGRVVRNSPLSIHFILQGLISMLGGIAAALFSIFMLSLAEAPGIPIWAALIGGIVAGLLMYLYIATVNYTTSDERLQKLMK